VSVSDVITVSGGEALFTEAFVPCSFYMARASSASSDLVRETNELLDAMNDFTAAEGEIGGDGVLLLET